MFVSGRISFKKAPFTPATYGVFKHRLKLECPPKDRSALYQLPVYRKIFFVSLGWCYPELDRRKEYSEEPPVKVMLPLLTFVKGRTHKILESFTEEEILFLFENADHIRRMFDYQSALIAKQESNDALLEHICR